MKRQNAFTLAEVLITLAVIGIVAAITIPALVNNYRERVTVTGLKKMYSTLTRAYQLAVAEYGTPENWNLEKYQYSEDEGKFITSGSADALMKMFTRSLKVEKFCKAADADCMKEIDYKFLNGNSDGQNWRTGRFSTAILTNGVIIYEYVNSENCSTIINADKNLKNCASFYVDLNGYSEPNQRGIDFFEFILTNQGVYPQGTPITGRQEYSFDVTCKDKKTDKGYGCTAWVVTYDNMDYLKCNDLSWYGKHKCSD